MGMRNGFTLIEVTIVVALSGMLLTLLYQTYTNVMQSRSRVASRVRFVTHMPLIYQQFMRDITGMYVPEQAITDLFAQSQEQRKQSVRADTACVVDQSDENLSRFSGITTNPMTLENTPNRVRFVYQLVPNEQEQTYMLYRYQVSDLTKTPDNVVNEERGTKLLDGITSMNITLLVPEQESGEEQQESEQTQQEQERDQKQDEQASVNYVEHTQWPISQEQLPTHLVPAYVHIDMRGQDMYERSFHEQYTCAVLAFDGIQHTYKTEYDHAQQEQQKQQKQSEDSQEQSSSNTPQRQSDQKSQQKPAQKMMPQTRAQPQSQQNGQQQVTTRRIYVPQQQVHVIPQGQA